MADDPVILWFRNDLRLADNPALHAATRQSEKVIPVFIDDETNGRPLGSAAKWWRAASLSALDADIRARGSSLLFFAGETIAILDRLVKETGAKSVYWSRSYDPATIERDKSLKSHFINQGIDAKSFAGHLLFEPWEISTKSGGPFKVFTPFWKNCLSLKPQRKVCEAPKKLLNHNLSCDPLPTVQNDALARHWSPGESGARTRLQLFLSTLINGYAENRNMPSLDATSRLSPHLRWGEISPLTIWQAVRHHQDNGTINQNDGEKFLSEIGWREFSAQLLFHNPDLPTSNLQDRFDAFPWQNNTSLRQCWERAETGYPIVDAGMRELEQTGFMHNRVRMIVASFLIKHLLTDWRHGEAFFWDKLVDADPANNTASWQWVAGSGADAAPYFRIFNPITQGQKFDPDGKYTRTYLPEIAGLPNKYLFSPWTAPQDVLSDSGISLGETYPLPAVDHSEARNKALSAFASLRSDVS